MSAAVLEINDQVVTGISEWDATWEERIDGVGSASVTVQDRNMVGPEYGRGHDITGGGSTTVGWRDLLRISADGINFFHGEIVHSNLDLKVAFPWRRWHITASDFNTLMDLRLVGAPDGYTWETIDGGVTHQVVDPNARGLSTDALTVQALFDNYVRKPQPDGGALDTTTYVHSWIPISIMTDPLTSQTRLIWTNTTLRSALDEIRALSGFPVFCWIDPDDAVHWMAFQSWDLIGGEGLPLLMPLTPFATPAPAKISDDSGEVNGTTVIGGRNFSIDYDATYMPQETYTTGVTDFIYNGGSTIFQGTGWDSGGSHNRQHTDFRQVSIDAQAVTAAQRSSVSKAYVNYARRARIRGSITVGKEDEAVDGWRVGQYVTIKDDRLPAGLNNHQFVIQRVQGKLKAGWDWREYTLEFGDFPIARFSQKYRTTPQRLPSARLPSSRHLVELPTHHLLPSTSYTLYSQMVDHSGKPLRMSGVPVTWALSVTDSTGAPVSTGSLAPINSPCVTDQHGRTAATLTTGSGTGLHYHCTATTPAQ